MQKPLFNCRSVRVLALLGTVATTLVATTLQAQTAPSPAQAPFPGFSSKPTVVGPITGVEGKEVALTLVSLEVGASSPTHTHPGDCYGMVLEGTIEMRADGQPPRRLTAGESYSNLSGVVHGFTNVGDKPVRLLNTLVVDKGKPRLVPQPAAAK